jgi:hypothetical protein
MGVTLCLPPRVAGHQTVRNALIWPHPRPSCVLPFRLGATKLLAAQRLQSWTRDFDLWKEVEQQLEGRRWPMSCPHPLCDIRLEDEDDLRYFVSNKQDNPQQCFEELLPPISRLYTRAYKQHISDVQSKSAESPPFIFRFPHTTYEEYTSQYRTAGVFPHEISSVNQHVQDDDDEPKNDDCSRESALIEGNDGTFCRVCSRTYPFGPSYHMYLEIFTLHANIRSIPLDNELERDILQDASPPRGILSCS